MFNTVRDVPLYLGVIFLYHFKSGTNSEVVMCQGGGGGFHACKRFDFMHVRMELILSTQLTFFHPHPSIVINNYPLINTGHTYISKLLWYHGS